MFKKICCLFLSVVFVCSLSGCIEEYLTINYKNNTYSLTYDWGMKTDNYEIVTVVEDGTELSLRIYNDDKNNEFIYCENSGSLYHNDNIEFPKNNSENIEKLLFSFPLKNGEILECTDEEIIKDFSYAVLEGECVDGIDLKDNLTSIWVEYKNYPATYFCGNIKQDKQLRFWIEVNNDIVKDGEIEYIEQYYLLDSNSYLVKYVLDNKV